MTVAIEVCVRPHYRKRQLEVPPDPRAHFERRSEFIESIFNQPCLSELETFFVANRKNKTPIWTETDLNRKLDEVTLKSHFETILSHSHNFSPSPTAGKEQGEE